jgi:hypothetical protein
MQRAPTHLRRLFALAVCLAGPAAAGPAQPPSAPAPSAASAPVAASPASAAARRNWFDDPFVQATRGLAGCPAPDPPLLTEAEMRHEEHWRAERGTSCFRSGRCRLPNAYLYDKEIVPRVLKAIDAAGGFEDTSIWVEGQRRWVWLKGCVSTREQADELERLVRLIDDVEAVIPQLMVWPPVPGKVPPYRLPPGTGAGSATIAPPATAASSIR